MVDVNVGETPWNTPEEDAEDQLIDSILSQEINVKLALNLFQYSDKYFL